jgi:ER-bound oxygenase mpaB/B'/Rubber oxygenase, catalytic domain
MHHRDHWLNQIIELDPVTDHCEIYRISAGYEFPWDYQRSLELALFRTFCVPSISALLSATGEFRDRPQKRYDDTALLMAELAAHGYDSERGKEALRVINRAHGRYPIAPEDMRYVLSTFIYDPIDWIDQFGWRPLSTSERLASFHFYRQVGLRMGIREMPDDFDEFRAYKRDYEQTMFTFADTNQEIGRYTLALMCGWYPLPLRPAVRLGVRSLLDERMLGAFGFAPAPAWVVRATHEALRARAAVVRRMPVRMTNRLGRDPHNRTYPGYPDGYRPADLGADADSR